MAFKDDKGNWSGLEMRATKKEDKAILSALDNKRVKVFHEGNAIVLVIGK